jgi:hypothetical protein
MAKVNYYEYINSPAWSAKRTSFLASGHKRSRYCYTCRRPWQKGWHIHHLTYERLGEENFNDLTVICPICHEKIHDLHNMLVDRQGRKGPKVSLKNSSKKARRAHKAELREEKKRNASRKKHEYKYLFTEIAPFNNR